LLHTDIFIHCANFTAVIQRPPVAEVWKSTQKCGKGAKSVVSEMMWLWYWQPPHNYHHVWCWIKYLCLRHSCLWDCNMVSD
jgi:hypothetical protein